ncbi:hypothetical protein STAS_25128 [Striga asiatica]|uniref:Uncharacterized protein n=1 Tax=Striga asiatica TaxID=4170 RepID=A0A5A7QRW5_STRAF|nr:hypothetical protein STAS_25128 [Striga asiatica]
MDYVNFDSVNPHGLEMRVQPFVHFIRKFRWDEPNTIVYNLVHSQILHRGLKPRRQLGLDHLRLRQARDVGPQPTPIPTQRVPHVHIIHTPEPLLKIPHKGPHPLIRAGPILIRALVLPKLPARHLLPGRRPVHPLGRDRVIVVANGLPPIVNQHEARRAPALHKPINPFPNPSRVHRKVERVPRAPPELIHDLRRSFLLEQTERA